MNHLYNELLELIRSKPTHYTRQYGDGSHGAMIVIELPDVGHGLDIRWHIKHYGERNDIFCMLYVSKIIFNSNVFNDEGKAYQTNLWYDKNEMEQLTILLEDNLGIELNDIWFYNKPTMALS